MNIGGGGGGGCHTTGKKWRGPKGYDESSKTLPKEEKVSVELQKI